MNICFIASELSYKFILSIQVWLHMCFKTPSPIFPFPSLLTIQNINKLTINIEVNRIYHTSLYLVYKCRLICGLVSLPPPPTASLLTVQ